MKLLVWLLFLGLVIAALYAKLSMARGRTAQPNQHRPVNNAGAETMMRCDHCGLYFPASEAIHRNNSVYCCEEHCGKPAQF
jgi:uncharacterized protein